VCCKNHSKQEASDLQADITFHYPKCQRDYTAITTDKSVPNPPSLEFQHVVELLIVDVFLVSQKITLGTLDFDTFKSGKTNKILIYC